MQCAIHPTREGVNTCCECGTWLCDECVVETGGRLFCRKCLQKAIAGGPSGGAERPRAPERRECRPESRECPPESRHVNMFLLLICSILPGANYMFEGLIKRGLFAMTAFFVLVSVMTVLDMPILGVVVCIFYVTSFFDGFHIRRKMNGGLRVEDGIEDIVSFVKSNRAAVIVTSVVFLALGFISGSGRYLVSRAPGMPGPGVFSSHAWISPSFGIAPLLFFALGIFFLVKLFGRPGRKVRRGPEERVWRGPEDGDSGKN